MGPRRSTAPGLLLPSVTPGTGGAGRQALDPAPAVHGAR